MLWACYCPKRQKKGFGARFASRDEVMKITLYGAASEKIDKAYKDAVYELGKEIAKRDHTMVFGAGASGLMGAAARGVNSGGGKIVGVTPHFMHDFEPVYENCTQLIDTETMSERKNIMEEMADAFIIVPGGIGTFDEFFQIITLKTLGRHDKPIVLFNVNGFWDNILSVIGSDIFKGFININVASCFCVCESAKTAIDTLEGLVGK